jgi:MarR family transcriptional regulator, 2-MHQ and catechol-resistance regulon repressor
MTLRPDPEEAPAPPETDAALKLWVVLSRAHASISAHAAAHAADHGLSLTEFAILEVLYHRGRMVLGDIQRRILVSSGGITFLVDRLAEKGLVVRQECPEDRRAKYVALTREGTRMIREIFPSHAQALTDAMRGLTPAEQREATGLLRSLGLAAAEGGLPPSPATLRRGRRGAKSKRS